MIANKKMAAAALLATAALAGCGKSSDTTATALTSSTGVRSA